MQDSSNTVTRRQPQLKRSVLNIHAWIGIVAAAFLLLISLSGICTAFKSEIDWALTPGLRVQPGQMKVPLDKVVAAVVSFDPALHVQSIELQNGARWAHVVKARKDGSAENTDVFVNPYTGAVQGMREGMSIAEKIKSFHTNLWLNFIPGKWGLIGRMIVSFFGFLLVCLSLTGLLIYRNKMRGLFRIRTCDGGRLFLSDLHQNLGFWTLGFHLIIGITATSFGISDSSHFFENRGGGRPERNRQEVPKNAGSVQSQGLQDAIDKAATAAPGVWFRRVMVPQKSGDSIKLSGTATGTIVPQQKFSVAVNTATGTVGDISDMRLRPASGKTIATMQTIHFVKWTEGRGPLAEYGLKIIWALLGLSPAILSFTGALMFFQRRRRSVPA